MFDGVDALIRALMSPAAAGPSGVPGARSAAGSRTAFSPAPARADLTLVDLARSASQPVLTYQAEHGTRLDARLAHLVPGVPLADELDRLTLADAPESVLVEAVAGWERMLAWAAARQAEAVAELAARAGGPALELLGDELASVVGQSVTVGRHLVGRALALGDLPEVRDALLAGQVCVKKADALAFTASFPTPEDRRAATTRILGDVPRAGVRAVQNRVRALAAALDTDGAARCRKAARAARYVRLEPVEDGMAYLTAYLPAEDAARVWAAVDDAGHTISRAPCETRTLAQARSDALVALSTGRLVVTPDPDDQPGLPGSAVPASDAPGPTTAYRVVPVPARATAHITVAATTLLCLDDAPGHLAGYGPVPAEVARVLATDATWRRLLTDAATGVLTDYATSTYAPGSVLRSAVEARDATCTFPGCERPARRCDLDHIDPYTREPGMAGEPQTRAANLHALCRRHHRAKTHAGWTPVRDEATGITTWHTPAGRSVCRAPAVVDPGYDVDSRHQLVGEHQAPCADEPGAPAPPPF